MTGICSIPVSAGQAGLWVLMLVTGVEMIRGGRAGPQENGHHPEEHWPQARSSQISSLPLAVGDHGFLKPSLEASGFHSKPGVDSWLIQGYHFLLLRLQ